MRLNESNNSLTNKMQEKTELMVARRKQCSKKKEDPKVMTWRIKQKWHV